MPAAAGFAAAVAAPLAAGTAGGRTFRILAWGLALHIVAMAMLFGFFGLPMAVVRAMAAWKELFAVIALLVVCVRAALGRTPPVTPNTADVAVLVLVALALLHVVASAGGWGAPSSLALVGLGVRDTVLCFALYAVGRATPGVATDGRAFRTLLIIGAVTSLIAVIERLVVTPERLVLLGVASYFNDFLGLGATTTTNVFGLPDNYWTYVGGRLVQRAGSVYLSSQGFAIPFLVIIPAATVWLFGDPRRRRVCTLVAYLLCWTGLLLSVTRMTTIACLLQILVIVLLMRRPAPLVALGAAGALSVAALVLAVPGLGWYLWDTLTWQTSSNASHAKDFASGVAALGAHPFGNGLATADATALRMGLIPLTADNLFLKYGVELGIPALLALCAWLAALLWRGASSALGEAAPERQALGAFLAACALGIAVNGTTAVVTSSLQVAYLFCWLAGSALTALAHGPLAITPQAIASAPHRDVRAQR